MGGIRIIMSEVKFLDFVKTNYFTKEVFINKVRGSKMIIVVLTIIYADWGWEGGKSFLLPPSA